MRARRLAVTSLALLTMLAVGGGLVWQGSHAELPLYQVGIARDVDGQLVPLSQQRWQTQDQERSTWGEQAPYVLAEGAASHPTTLAEALPWPEQVLGERAGAQAMLEFRAAAQSVASRAWLSQVELPGRHGPYAGMASRALLDLRTLTGPATTPGEVEGPGGEQATDVARGALLAGPSAHWRYVWPRDAAFGAVAYARSGQHEQAVALLGFLQEQQAPNGSMQARWLPDGTGNTPDTREQQEDGPGWALWAVREVLKQAETDSEQLASQLVPLITDSTSRLLARIDPSTELPRPSPDYWEVPEDELTLGIAATALMGLEAAAWVHERGLLDSQEWAQVEIDPATLASSAQQLRAEVEAEFGPAYPRHAGRGNPDAAIAFLGPPFVDEPLAGLEAARHQAVQQMMRPAGGLAPGASWKSDGISWTPETALFALAEAGAGEQARSRHWLDWLDEHRTVAGSLPEKVLHDGDPAAVAPLSWTGATVLITLSELAGQ